MSNIKYIDEKGVMIMTDNHRDRIHGSPEDRGSADAYYGRPPEPHWYPAGSYHGCRIERGGMTDEEIALYYKGYNEEEDRKDWG